MDVLSLKAAADIYSTLEGMVFDCIPLDVIVCILLSEV